MLFYALRVLCRSCGGAFLVGGAHEHDLTKWRAREVECPSCGTNTPAETGHTVELAGAHIGAVEEELPAPAPSRG